MKNYQKIIALSLIITPISASSQYKCIEYGKVIYAERPCGPSAKKLDINVPRVNDEEKTEAALNHERNKKALNQIEDRKRSDEMQRKKDIAIYDAAIAAKKNRCEDLVRTAKSAKNESAMYRYHLGLIEDAKRRQKEAEDAHFSECFGSGR